MSKLYDLLYAMIGKLNSSVKTTAQTLTDAEKTQARANIGAQPAGDYATKKDIPTIPSKLPNPHALTINGETYDGSSAVSITVEGGGGMGGADWNASEDEPGHVLNRTHWVEGGMKEIFAETLAIDDEGMGAPSSTIPLTVGVTYTVNWNGTEYICVAQDLSAMEPGAIGLGNLALAGFADTGEPFAFMCASYACMIKTLDGTVSADIPVTIRGYAETVHKIDTKFLPDGVGDSPIVVVSLKSIDMNTGEIFMSHTAGEIKDAVTYGKIVFMTIDGGVMLATGGFVDTGEVLLADFAEILDPTTTAQVDANGMLVI